MNCEQTFWKVITYQMNIQNNPLNADRAIHSSWRSTKSIQRNTFFNIRHVVGQNATQSGVGPNPTFISQSHQCAKLQIPVALKNTMRHL